MNSSSADPLYIISRCILKTLINLQRGLFLRQLHGLATDRDITYGYSRSKMRGEDVEVPFGVLLCYFYTLTDVQSLTLLLTEI